MNSKLYTIKPLQWDENKARTKDTYYVIRNLNHKNRLYVENDNLGDFGTFEQAQQAAQKHYEGIVSELLEEVEEERDMYRACKTCGEPCEFCKHKTI